MRIVSLILVFILAFSSVAFSGCSAYLAMTAKEEPDISRVQVDLAREQIELQLGDPVQSSKLADGGSADIYHYVSGDQPNAGRAVHHGVLDVLTLFLWELYASPIELAQGTKKGLEIRYDENDVVMSIRRVAVVGEAQE